MHTGLHARDLTRAVQARVRGELAAANKVIESQAVALADAVREESESAAKVKQLWEVMHERQRDLEGAMYARCASLRIAGTRANAAMSAAATTVTQRGRRRVGWRNKWLA